MSCFYGGIMSRFDKTSEFAHTIERKFIPGGGRYNLEFHVDNESYIVGIWLTNAEKKDDDLKKELQFVCDDYRNKKYKIAFFLSGNGNLLEYTQSLLLHNRYPKSHAV